MAVGVNRRRGQFTSTSVAPLMHRIL